jgi:hypothetical protein
LEIGVPCLLEPLVIQTIVPYSRFQVMDLSDEIALSDFLFDKTHVEFLLGLGNAGKVIYEGKFIIFVPLAQ